MKTNTGITYPGIRYLLGYLIPVFVFSSISFAQDSQFIRYQSPDFLSYDELVRLAKNPKPRGELKRKVEAIFKTPFISNEAFYSGKAPRKPYRPELGRVVRLASWNVEKAIGLDAVITAFTSPTRFQNLIDSYRCPAGSPKYQQAIAQRTLLETADIVVLQEMDLGMKRSNYRNSARDLAQALGMNYAFGTEQLEIDPVNLGMKEEFIYEDNRVDQKMFDTFQVNPEKYRGIVGSAVLSRYPIKHAELFQLNYQAYDWYYDEGRRIPAFKKVSRVESQKEFLEKLMREMKVGGRIYFRVDLEIPELPEKTLTVINVNLEMKCAPAKREIQMNEILNYIRTIKHPVVLAGDFNSASGDPSAFQVKSELKRAAAEPSFWISPVISLLIPGGILINAGRQILNFGKNYHDPTAANVPVLAPNQTRGLFDEIEHFRFSDNKAFDFRGSPLRSINGKSAPLANSNEREGMGYKTTFDTYRSLYNSSGKYRLDWIFVKPVELYHPFDPKGRYWFAPHYGATLAELNQSFKRYVSDHSPNIVDLPLTEPLIDDPIESSYIKSAKKLGMKG